MITKKLTFDYVKNCIENVDGYSLLSTNYVNNISKLKIMCDKGHVFEKSFSHFQRGQHCPYCNNKYHLQYDFVKKQIEKNDGYILLSTEFINSYSKLSVRCPEGHIFDISYSNFSQGCRCRECRDSRKRYTYNDVKNIMNKRGFDLLSDTYYNNKSQLKIKCSKGHIFYPRFYNFKNSDTECPYCKKLKSKKEFEIVKFIKTIYDGKILENYRTTIKNPLTGKFLELDVFLPDINKAIEYNGVYWHSSKYSKFKDSEKMKQCKRMGIQLLVLNEGID